MNQNDTISTMHKVYLLTWYATPYGSWNSYQTEPIVFANESDAIAHMAEVKQRGNSHSFAITPHEVR